MKLNFVESIRRLRIKSLPVLFSLLLSPFAGMAADPTYDNSGSINNANLPQVDATNFVNSGTWDIGTTAPYKTADTLNYTNTGTMTGSVGWEFDYGPLPAGGRGMSASFFNGNGATIQAVDGEILNPYVGTTLAESLASYLLISATNIVNEGTLIAGANGEIVLTGTNVTLIRSGLEITSIQGQGSSNSTNNYTPDIAIYDEFWLESTNLTITNSPWNGTTVSAFTGRNVGEPCGITNATIQIGPLTPQVADSYTTNLNPYVVVTTNSLGNPNPPVTLYSNIINQASFVAVSDPNITAINHFTPSLLPTNAFQTVAVQFSMSSTNVVTQAAQTTMLYLVDDLASSTNRTLLTNSVINPAAACTSPTLRPSTVIVSRTDPNQTFASGAPGLGPPPANFFYDPTTFSNALAMGVCDVYSALVDNLASEIPASPEGDNITNLPGRIQIYADNLDLTKTRMDDQGAEVTIVATNLIGSAGAAISCQNLSFNLGSTAGFLNVTNLVVPNVSRLHGTVDEWSGLWTNDMYAIFTNNFVPVITNNMTNYVQSPLTNVEEMDLAITVVDASGLLSEVPVTVQNLILNSTNMTISDAIDDVGQSFFFGGQSLTILGSLNLSGVPDWVYTNAPTLQYFTNNGVLTIPNDAHFGDDGPTNYIEFVNNGTISAGSQTIKSVDYQNAGSQSASGGFYVTSSSGKVQGGGINSGQDVRFNSGTLKFNDATIVAGGQLYLNVTNSLFDTGGSSSNVLTCNNGFDFPVKPVTGDLLGTELETITPEFADVDHYWAGTDFGVSSAGYSNNVALGQLVLVEGGRDSAGTASEFSFHATGSSNAVYVDLLDLSQCPDFLDPTVLTMDPNFVIYYAAAKLPSTFTIPPNGGGIPQEAEEFLNGQFSGHLRWVNSFAGPNSSVDVLINGQTVAVNKALRYSKIIDSNGDGVPNYYDPNPFNTSAPFILAGAMVQANPPPANKFAISWTAAPNTAYQVQYSANVSPGSWQPLLNYTNNTASSNAVTVWDTNAVSNQRFYRVSHP